MRQKKSRMFERIAEVCIEELGLKDKVAVLFCNDKYITKLNKEFLGRDKPTNVLAFHGERERNYLGDIVVSVEMVERQAKRAGIKPELWLAEVILHGILHLKGERHSPCMRKKQRRIAERVMKRLRI